MIAISEDSVPNNMLLIQMALMEIDEFCKNNYIEFDIRSFQIHNRHHSTCFGFFIPRTGKIKLFIKELKQPAKVPHSKDASWPGFYIDNTPVGIIAHEFGHWLVDNYGISSKRIKNIVSGNTVIHRASDGVEERFVEAFRIFLINPMLLKEGRPDYWNCFTKILNLRPIHRKPWEKILSNAHPEYIRMCREWIKRKDLPNEKLSS